MCYVSLQFTWEWLEEILVRGLSVYVDLCMVAVHGLIRWVHSVGVVSVDTASEVGSRLISFLPRLDESAK